MAKIGYARVSSKEQNLDRQLKALEGVSKVFSDKASGQSVERPQLQAMLNYIREGDIVVVTELDRLGRNNKELTELMNQIQIKGATLEVCPEEADGLTYIKVMPNGFEDPVFKRLAKALKPRIDKFGELIDKYLFAY